MTPPADPTPAEIRDDAWSLLLDYAAETGTLANECEHAGIDAEEVARLREKSAKIRAAATSLAGMCVLPVEVVRHLVGCDCREVYGYVPGTEISAPGVTGGVVSVQWPDEHSTALAAAEAEVARVEGR